MMSEETFDQRAVLSNVDLTTFQRFDFVDEFSDIDAAIENLVAFTVHTCMPIPAR